MGVTYAAAPEHHVIQHEAAPVTYAAAPVTYAAAPAVEPTVIHQAAPVIHQAAPVTYAAAPVTYAAAPTYHHILQPAESMVAAPAFAAAPAAEEPAEAAA